MKMLFHGFFIVLVLSFLSACSIGSGDDKDDLTGKPEIDVRQGGVSIPSGSGTKSFGTVTAGSSADLVFTIVNVGGAELSLTGNPLVALSGTNASEFSVSAQPAAAAVASGATASFTLRFSPASVGSKTAAVTIANSDADEGTYTFAVTGVCGGAPGSLVASFGTNGLVVHGLCTEHNEIVDLAVQADGKIVAAVHMVVAGDYGEIAAVRFNADGSLDTSFGTGGIASVDVLGDDYGNNANAVVIQPDGKIVVVGYRDDAVMSPNSDITLVRFTSSGALDPGFGTGGIVTQDFGTGVSDEAHEAALDAAGNIVVLGSIYRGTSTEMMVCRFTPSGTLDASFNDTETPGSKVIRTGEVDGPRALAIQSDGKILAAGSFSLAAASNQNFVAARLNADGTPDGGFGTGGVAEYDSGTDEEAFAVLVQPDGSILLAGAHYNSGLSDAMVVRFTSSGVLDTSFGGGTGRVIKDTGSNDEQVFALALQADGKIVTAGYSYQGSNYYFSLLRYTQAGVPDTGFGTNGVSLVPYDPGNGQLNDIALLDDGTILGAGKVDEEALGDAVLAKFWR